MRSLCIEVGLEMIQFPRQVSGIPEEDLVKEFPTYTSDQPFNERMGHGHMREGLDFIDLENAKIGLPLRESEERIIVTAEIDRRSHARNRLGEHPAKCNAINSADLNTKADDPPRVLIHHHHHPMGPQRNGLTPKQVDAPQTVLHVADQRQPRRLTAPGIWLVVLGQDPTDDVLVDLETECLVDLLRDSGTTKARIATLHLDDGIDEFL